MSSSYMRVNGSPSWHCDGFEQPALGEGDRQEAGQQYGEFDSSLSGAETDVYNGGSELGR